MTRSGSATFSQVVRWSSSRKSWKTMPIRRLRAARPKRHEKQAQKRGLSGSRGAGQEVKGPRKHVKGDISQDFRACAIAKPDIVKANHPSSLRLLTLPTSGSLC